ncbi:MAG: hypothetical protein ACRC2V_18645 [Xenococcaceae cyanobacterium]
MALQQQDDFDAAIEVCARAGIRGKAIRQAIEISQSYLPQDICQEITMRLRSTTALSNRNGDHTNLRYPQILSPRKPIGD